MKQKTDAAIFTEATLETIVEWRKSPLACAKMVCHALEELLTRVEQDIANHNARREEPCLIRELVWKKETGHIARCLGVTPARQRELDAFVNGFIQRDATLRALIDALNARDDLTDAEWTAILYTIGYYQGERA